MLKTKNLVIPINRSFRYSFKATDINAAGATVVKNLVGCKVLAEIRKNTSMSSGLVAAFEAEVDELTSDIHLNMRYALTELQLVTGELVYLASDGSWVTGDDEPVAYEQVKLALAKKLPIGVYDVVLLANNLAKTILSGAVTFVLTVTQLTGAAGAGNVIQLENGDLWVTEGGDNVVT